MAEKVELKGAKNGDFNGAMGFRKRSNVVTSTEGKPHAVLIRAIQPTQGLEKILERRKKNKISSILTNGPGALCQALGITRELNSHPFNSYPLWIEDANLTPDPAAITVTSRIGVDYAGEDAQRPWRFLLESLFENS